MQKRIVWFFILCLCFFPINVFASTNTKVRTEENYLVSDWVKITNENKEDILMTPAVDSNEKIYDFANLFSTFDEEILYSLVSDYINSYHMDLAIVTISQNNKGNQASYADDFYDYNAFGIGDERDGVLFLVDMEYRQIYLSTTGYAISIYNDARIDLILNKLSPSFTHKEYVEGMREGIVLLSKYAKEGLPSKQSKQSVGIQILYASIFSFIVTVIIMFCLIRKNRLAKVATTAEEYLAQESIMIHSLGDVFIGSNTIKHPISHDTSGGSSTHSSSSGSSHGGGGHGF